MFYSPSQSDLTLLILFISVIVLQCFCPIFSILSSQVMQSLTRPNLSSFRISRTFFAFLSSPILLTWSYHLILSSSTKLTNAYLLFTWLKEFYRGLFYAPMEHNRIKSKEQNEFLTKHYVQTWLFFYIIAVKIQIVVTSVDDILNSLAINIAASDVR